MPSVLSYSTSFKTKYDSPLRVDLAGRFGEEKGKREMRKISMIGSVTTESVHITSNDLREGEVLFNYVGLPGGSVAKNLPANAGDAGLILGSRRYPGEGNGNLLQYYCLGNPMDRGAWWGIFHGVAKSWTGLSTQ